MPAAGTRAACQQSPVHPSQSCASGDRAIAIEPVGDHDAYPIVYTRRPPVRNSRAATRTRHVDPEPNGGWLRPARGGGRGLWQGGRDTLRHRSRQAQLISPGGASVVTPPVAGCVAARRSTDARRSAHAGRSADAGGSAGASRSAGSAWHARPGATATSTGAATTATSSGNDARAAGQSHPARQRRRS
jgi:hypothetical protein